MKKFLLGTTIFLAFIVYGTYAFSQYSSIHTGAEVDASVTFTQSINATASEINTPLDGATVQLTEFRELEAIGDTVISAAQWAHLGDMDQDVATDSSVTFGSIDATATASPSWEFKDSDNAAGTATIYGNSSGGDNDIILSLGVEEAGSENVEYMQIDGVSETVDFLKPINVNNDLSLTFQETDSDPDDATVALSASDGVLTIAAGSGVNNEDLTIDLDQTANTAIVGSSGVTDLSFSALNLITSGTISGEIEVITTTDGSESPTAQQMRGAFFVADHATPASDTTYTLPAATAGMSGCFYDNGGGTGGISIDPDASDYIILDGTAAAVGEMIDSPGIAGDGENGDFICLLAIDDTYWITLGRSGDWVEESP